MGRGRRNRTSPTNFDLALPDTSAREGRRKDARVNRKGAAVRGAVKPFWETKALEDMSAAEWESLCDGCGRCCLNKLEDEDTGEIVLTRLACALLDIGQCRCSDYPNRFAKMPDCINRPQMAAAHLRLPPRQGRSGVGLVAPAYFGRSRNRAPGRHIGESFCPLRKRRP
jgi:hypothetical protein